MDQVQNLIKLKNSMYNEMFDHEQKIIKCKHQINQIEQLLMDNCTHKWHYDYCYGSHDKPDKVCDLCGTRKVRH